MTTGPWAERRGFDNLVQAATGMAAIEATTDTPGALPAQALDHGTGYLMAADVLKALTDRSREGGSTILRYALAQTAVWLLNGTPTDTATPAGEPAPAPILCHTGSRLGQLRHASSPVRYEGGPDNWTRPPGAWDTDAAQWLTHN